MNPSQLMGRCKEDDKSYRIRYDVPGLGKEDEKIMVEDGILTIKGEHKEEKEGSDDDDESWSSISYGYYNNNILLPEDAKADEIKAIVKDGVLTITIPKNGVTTSSASSGSTIKPPPTMDPAHVYYLHSSDSPGMRLVNSLFDGKDSQSPNLQFWNKYNGMIISWLLNSLSKDIADSVIYSRTAKDLWLSLEHRFRQEELNELVQGNNDIAGYFNKLKRLWDELESLNSEIKCSCVCTCEGKLKLEKSLEDEKLIQFLIGLNDVYARARGNILIMNPLPNINVAYSLVLQDENQRETYMSPLVPADSSSFMVSNTNQYKFARKVQKSLNPMPNYPRMNNFPQQPKFTKTNQQGQKFKVKKKYNPNVSCD
ncbi:26.5 kDa heat shock protein, mitochondrial [Capsicum annuum]|nr:26.5 kDa heat shock protein, mitochondrial [Capsicum annuum]KAF3647184.1 26.5 kDa heat shock protein, mitochondrial [Capsicum annuum]